ncbi:MAG: oxidoreductase [Myxococcales bacterium]
MSPEFRLGGDLPIKRLGFGAMRLPTASWQGPPRDPETGRAILRRALELGVNHIDTADFYRSNDGSVRANTLIREALQPYPIGLVIATKVGPVFGPQGIRAAAPEQLRSLVEANLETLGRSCLDLVYLRIGAMEGPPRGESLAARFEALAKLREEGLIRHLGLSNVDAAQLAEARAIAQVAAVQNNFHVANREEAAVLEVCAANGIAFAPFFPLGGGYTDLHAADEVAKRRNATSAQVALAWLLKLSPVTIAIPGTGSIAHLEENMRAASLSLASEDLAELANAGAK